MLSIRRLDSAAPEFERDLGTLVNWQAIADDGVETAVKEIIAEVRRRGNEALVDYTNRFDRRDLVSFDQLEIPKTTLQSAFDDLPEAQRSALSQSAERISAFHSHQLAKSWQYEDDLGVVLGQQITSLDRVGIYVPGGKASYPSSVLMNAIPAKVAGVAHILMTVPAPEGDLNAMVLAAAHVAGVDRVLTVGGAQAVAAMAYGTESILPVDKITGPGNVYVAMAKRLVFGQVGLDMIAGPSEILVVCDGKTSPDWIAMDLFSQAEHDENAQALLVSPDPGFLDAVEASMNALLPTLPRRDIIEQSIKERCAFISIPSMEDAPSVINRIAPEHLELSIENAESMLPFIRHAGAIFMGRYTSEALGDYCAGPNHVLPTSTTARFASPLGVYDFQKRTSIVDCSQSAASVLGKVASTMARSESLTAHALSAEYRVVDGEL